MYFLHFLYQLYIHVQNFTAIFITGQNEDNIFNGMITYIF